ncbi:MAG TPA: hypothetical protein VLK29_02905 [Luteimonas sp.]|nr:hypothetical protein [Luteimonas sp.]
MTRGRDGAAARLRVAASPALALLALLLAGCLGAASPVQTGDAGRPVGGAGPVAAVGAARPAAAAPLVDLSCSVDADCVVKDVGSCCGVRPACVNRAATVDADAVAAACRASGRMSTCGFQVVEACSCNEGPCRARRDVVGRWLAEPAGGTAVASGDAS